MPAPVKSPDPSKLWCGGCQQFLPFDSFWPDKNAGQYRTDPDGVRRSARCKQCKTREYTKIDPRRKLWYNAKKRAKERGLDFNLEVSDIVIPETCPALGIPLFPCVGKGRVSMKHAWNSPTLDRIDPSGGYVKGNVCVISARANFLKNDASVDELRAILAYIDTQMPT